MSLTNRISKLSEGAVKQRRWRGGGRMTSQSGRYFWWMNDKQLSIDLKTVKRVCPLVSPFAFTAELVQMNRDVRISEVDKFILHQKWSNKIFFHFTQAKNACFQDDTSLRFCKKHICRYLTFYAWSFSFKNSRMCSVFQESMLKVSTWPWASFISNTGSAPEG